MSYNFTSFKKELHEAEVWLATELAQIHAGRATPLVLDGVFVEAYGAKSPIAHVASITVEDPKTLRIAPWDKSQVKEIQRAIDAANLGLSTSPDEAGLRVIFPELSSERRQSLAKVVREKLEKARITVRHERDKAWNDIQEKEKNGEMAEDDKFRAKEEMEKLVSETNASLEGLIQKKEKEITG